MPTIEPGQELTVADLRRVNQDYVNNVAEWIFLMAAYEGTKELVKKGYLYQNERESLKNYERRKKEAYGFDYSQSIVNLLNYYLFKKPVKRDMGKLKNDASWEQFQNDCNLYGDGFDDFLTEQGRFASIEGHVGIMVDKPATQLENRAEEIEEKVYPYLSAYLPQAILDWEYDRDKNNRPFLSFLKLKDQDGKYRLWWPGKWEIWEEPTEKKETIVNTSLALNTVVELTTTTETPGDGNVRQETKATKVDEGEYDLEEIPWVWLINVRSKKRPIGMSDIHEVARLDASILRNLSQGEEVISYGAFPMMRKPYKDAKPDGGISAPHEDQVGVQVILEFDPENPESKPDWLEAEVKEVVDALLDWIQRKAEEIYRVVNAGGMASTEISTAPKSGAALKVEFQLLNASLVRKAKNLEKAEKDIIRYFLAWQNQEEYFEDISLERSRTYDVEDLASDLENALTASIIVKSKKFNDRLQKNIVRAMLPAAEEDEIKEMDQEIDEYVEPEPEEFIPEAEEEDFLNA